MLRIEKGIIPFSVSLLGFASIASVQGGIHSNSMINELNKIWIITQVILFIEFIIG